MPGEPRGPLRAYAVSVPTAGAPFRRYSAENPVAIPARGCIPGSSMVPSCGIAERRQRMARGKVGVAFCGFSLPHEARDFNLPVSRSWSAFPLV